MTSFTRHDLDIINNDEVYKGFFKVNKIQLRFKLFDGGMSAPVFREVSERHNAVGVLPYDPDKDQVVLIEQFRIGALASESPWLLELVAGLVDTEESHVEVVERELNEEAGLALLDIEPICHYYPSPGGSSEQMHLFCGRVNADNDGLVFGVADESEDIKVHVLSVDEAFALVKENKINNAASLIALQWLMLHKDRIRQQWVS